MNNCPREFISGKYITSSEKVAGYRFAHNALFAVLNMVECHDDDIPDRNQLKEPLLAFKAATCELLEAWAEDCQFPKTLEEMKGCIVDGYLMLLVDEYLLGEKDYNGMSLEAEEFTTYYIKDLVVEATELISILFSIFGNPKATPN